MMTTVCAWCDTVLEVDLAALAGKGISHGICPQCLPEIFGQEAAATYQADHPDNSENFQFHPSPFPISAENLPAEIGTAMEARQHE